MTQIQRQIQVGYFNSKFLLQARDIVSCACNDVS